MRRQRRRPLRLVVTVAPGAGADTMARAAGQMLSDRLAAEGAQPDERATSEEIRAQIVRDYAEFERQVKQLNVELN